MSEINTGVEVVDQARDNSLLNRDPAIVKGAVVGVIGAIGSIAVIGGWIAPSEVDALKENAGIIVPALFAIASVAQAIWTRASVYSPRTAARIAITNSAKPSGASPTLITPP